jgi:type I restriction enzyme S subunit
MPNLQTQEEILLQLDAMSLQVGYIEAIYQQKLTFLAELKQAILRKAFAGELTSSPEKALKEAAA